MGKKTAIVGIVLVLLLGAVLTVTRAIAAPALNPVAVRAAAAAAGFTSLAEHGIPQVNNMGEFLNPGPGAKSAAVVLGKALFWDMQVGSDGQACASCHFAAGADNRVKNQLNPGLRSGDGAFGNSGIASVAGYSQLAPNYPVVKGDFPTHQLADPGLTGFNHRVIVKTTNDVVTSQGVFNANFTGTVPGQMNDNGAAVADAVFNVGGVNVRRNPPRNAPSVINAVFNVDNFWDGRANNKFNGINPLGPLDSDAKILVNTANLTQVAISIPNSSLASQAVGPPLSDVEMSFAGRTFPDIGKKLLAARPLAFQKVHANDGALGPFSRIGQAAPNDKGLTFATYAELVQTVFQPRYWNSDKIITFNTDGSRVINPPGTSGGYTQMEANFSLFFGLAIQAYESTLVSDRTRFDLFMEGDNDALDQDELSGLLTFINQGTLAQQADPLFRDISQGGCLGCHKSTTFSDATFAGMGAEGPIELETAPVLVDGELKLGTELILLDNGYYNIGVRPTAEDLGRGGTENGKPLSATRQALQGFLFAPTIPIGAPQNPRAFVDGAFKVPNLRNVELTGPYFHNGGQQTLRQVMDFYRRNGDFSDMNINNLDGPLALVDLRPADFTGRDTDVDRLVKFLLTLTDERVRNEMAPFDHPQLIVPNGHPGDGTSITQFDVVNGVNQALDTTLEVSAVGSSGRKAAGLPLTLGFLSTGAIQGNNIPLRPGWNTLSTPITLHSTADTWGEFATVNGLNYQLAYSWNGNSFQLVDPASVLSPLDAIYVSMSTAAVAEIIPSESISAPASKTLTPGWNFVGSAFLQIDMPVKDALSSAFFASSTQTVPNAQPLWGYSEVISPPINIFEWAYLRDNPVIPSMRLGEGYWVFMSNQGEVSGFTSTPLQFPK